MSLTTQTLSFNLENIQPGHLVILYDRQELFGTGIIIEVEPLELIIALRSVNPVSTPTTFNEEYNDLLQNIVPYRLRIKFIESGDINIYLINPHLYGKGQDHAPVDY